MKRAVAPLLFVLLLSSASFGQDTASTETRLPQTQGTTPFTAVGRAFSARPANGGYFMVDYTDPFNTDDVGVWDYPFQTYGIDYDFDEFYEPPNPYGLTLPTHLPVATY